MDDRFRNSHSLNHSRKRSELFCITFQLRHDLLTLLSMPKSTKSSVQVKQATSARIAQVLHHRSPLVPRGMNSAIRILICPAPDLAGMIRRADMWNAFIMLHLHRTTEDRSPFPTGEDSRTCATSNLAHTVMASSNGSAVLSQQRCLQVFATSAPLKCLSCSSSARTASVDELITSFPPSLRISQISTFSISGLDSGDVAP